MFSFLKKKKYIIAAICFVVGLSIFILPYAQEKTGIFELPITGEETDLSVDLSVDKSDVQRDDPAEGAQEIHYSIEVANNAPCAAAPVDVMLVYDVSGSMYSYIGDAKQAGVTFVQNLDFSKDQAGIATYNDSGKLRQDLSQSEVQLISSINGLYAGGLTNIGNGISIASQELQSTRHNYSATPVMIIFTDGQANRPGGVNPAQYALDQADLAKSAGIRVISIAFGRYADTHLMQQIASPGLGNYYYAPTGSDMIQIYAAISESLQGNSPDTVVDIDISALTDIVNVTQISSGGYSTNSALHWDLGTLQCQESRTLDFILEVNNKASDLEVIDILALLSNGNGDSTSSQNASITVHAPAFNISKTDHQDEVMPGEETTYDLLVENVGTGNAYDVVFTDYLPQQYYFVDEQTIDVEGEFDASLNLVAWNNSNSGYILDGSFEPTGSSWGSSKSFTFGGNVDNNLSQGYYTVENTFALVTANGFTQEAVDETVIPYGCDLEVTKTSAPTDYVSWSNAVTYILVVTNNGRLIADDVVIIDDYDESHISIQNAHDGVISNGTIQWDFEEIEVGESVSLSYEVDVNQFNNENTADIQNTVGVSSLTFDIDETNNQTNYEITATDDPILEIEKTVTPSVITPNDDVSYTITVTNVSNVIAYDFILTDTLLDEFDFLADSVEVSGVTLPDPQVSGNILWTGAQLESGDSFSITFSTRPNEQCQITSYQTAATIQWEDEDGNSFGPRVADVLVTVVSESEQQDTVSSPTLPAPDSESVTQSLLGAFSSLVVTGEAGVYIKVILGLCLTLPLPLLLILEQGKKRGYNKKKGKKKRTIKKSRKKSKSKRKSTKKKK